MEHPFNLLNLEPETVENPLEPTATTLALGEEGGEDDPILSTQALGEEGGDGPIFTTLAIGEEGGDDPIATTLAIGEEGGDDPIVTTLALGEEGGDGDGEQNYKVLVPENLNSRREARLDRVLGRITTVFGQEAIASKNETALEISIPDPLSVRDERRWNRFLTRLQRIVGEDNVMKINEALPIHPFDVQPIAQLIPDHEGATGIAPLIADENLLPEGDHTPFMAVQTTQTFLPPQ